MPHPTPNKPAMSVAGSATRKLPQRSGSSEYFGLVAHRLPEVHDLGVAAVVGDRRADEIAERDLEQRLNPLLEQEEEDQRDDDHGRVATDTQQHLDDALARGASALTPRAAPPRLPHGRPGAAGGRSREIASPRQRRRTRSCHRPPLCGRPPPCPECRLRFYCDASWTPFRGMYSMSATTRCPSGPRIQSRYAFSSVEDLPVV